MSNYRDLESRLTEALHLARRPVAISLLQSQPAGMEPLRGSQPSGCSFWRLASEGQSFFTVPSDHYNCAIGCYTHNIALPPEREHELMDTVSLMVQIGYIKQEEVPGIARLQATPKFTAYAPLGDASVAPDVVLVVGHPGRLMLLQEAALRAGVGANSSLFGRPTCMSIPLAIARGTTASTGCIGNRVYTELGDDELYVAIPGPDLEKIVDALDTIIDANARLTLYHQGRKQSLTSA